MSTSRWFVVGLCSLGLAAGGVAWWVRFDATRQSLEFWDPIGAQLLVEQADLAVRDLPDGDWQELAQAKGLVHMQHFLALDRSFDWTVTPDPAATDWRWQFRLHKGERAAEFAVSGDCLAIGRVDKTGGFHRTVSCAPIAKSLTDYFTALGLIAPEKPADEAR
ncbi:MAG: hypothetical protein AAGA92_09115 [Planctomycetota bacterium]